MYRFWLCLCLSGFVSIPASAQLTGTLTNGNATFSQNGTPTSISPSTDTTQFRASFRPEGGSTSNSLYDQWMFYRVAGDTRERPFGNYSSGGITTSLTGNFSGSTATYSLTDVNTNPTPDVARFTATWTMNLVDNAAPNSASLNHTVRINNPGANPLTISLIQYVDLDLANTAGNQTATGGINGMYSTDGTLIGSLVATTPVTAFQASAFSTLRTALTNNTVTDLNNSGLPFSPGDVTFAYQWNVTIPAGGSTVIQSQMGISPVPEPGVILACCLGFAGLARLYQNRRNVIA
jgi:hypothetical protein